MLRSGFASCRFGKLGMRACATAAAAKAPETAAPVGDVLPNELAEHEAFLKFCHERGKLSVRGLAIRSTCSSSSKGQAWHVRHRVKASHSPAKARS